jgi:aspartate ammonia-lyase
MIKKNNKRTEKDLLGSVEIPKNAYYGTTTQRAINNFQISGLTSPKVFHESLGIVKLAAAKSNIHLNLINKKDGEAIIKACEEFIEGRFENEFILDIFQAGAGTSYNMNANEIIANRANEILKAPKGSYKFIHPNNHVNMGQSTNDVIPTATKIAILFSLPKLLKAIAELESELNKKSKKYAKINKVGRTHLQDGVPISMGQVFDSYKEAIKKSREFIELTSENLQILGIGATAVGTGITSHPKYKDLTIKNLTELTGIEFKSAKNLTESINNFNDFLNFSSGLKGLSTNLLNISETLKIMASGPKAGLNEITIPAVQPGSSIMPGKINPSIIEALEMICLQICGNDKTIEMSAQKSQFELNIFCPVIMHNILYSMEILANGINMFTNLCLKNLQVNTKKIKDEIENSLCTATALTPHIGYEKTAKVVADALKNHSTIRKEVLKKNILTEKKLNEIIGPEL